MNREKPESLEDIEDPIIDLEIREKISDVLKLIRNNKNYNPKDIDEEKIISSLIEEFDNLSKGSKMRESFLASIEEKIEIMILKKQRKREGEKFLNDINTIKKAHRIGKEAPEINEDTPGIQQAA